MKRLVNIFIIFAINFIILFNINAEEYEEYKSGDLVRYNNIAFYVLFDSSSTSDSVQVLKMVPLTHEEINKYTDNKAYYDYYGWDLIYYPSRDNIPYGNMAFYYSDDCHDNMHEKNCVNDYSVSNVKKVVDLWTQENINVDDIVEFEGGYKSRLLNVDEISVFDSTLDISNYSNSYDLKNIPNWLSAHSYHTWTMNGVTSRYFDSSNVSYTVDKVYTLNRERYSNISNYFVTSQTYSGGTVRPTIILKKKSISTVNNDNEYHNNAVREYKIGDIINYNDIKFYVIKNSSDSDSTVTLLKDKPLTKYELETYGEGYINNYVYEYNGNGLTPGNVIYDNGLHKVAYLSTDKCYFHNSISSDYSGCNLNYDVSNVKHIVDNWLLGNISVDDIALDEYDYNARIINEDDLVGLGYINIQANTAGSDSFKAGNDTPKFMLENENNNGMLTMIQSYYTGSRYNEYGIAIGDDGYSFVARSILGSFGTVRPVITLNKKEIAPKITNVEEIEDTVSGDDDSNNIEVDIETDVDNSNFEEDVKNALINSISVVVPNTLSSKSIVFIVVGIVVAIISLYIFIYFKKK